MAVAGRLSSPDISKDINTVDFIDIAVENIDIKTEKYFSNCITNYYSYGEKCNNYTTTLSVEKITNCPKWFVKYHYNKSYSMLDKRSQLGENLKVTDVNNDQYTCAYVLRDNGTRISIIAMKDNDYIELTISTPFDNGLPVNIEKALSYIGCFFEDAR